ncbi:hypothetical protein IGI37_003383 [Enterococcus sp. AZ194]|uniref:hypothetical protein n=1 Tax=Enterococcus sp. AZ194 TaxID=2774629 RepID=UPI003F28CF53
MEEKTMFADWVFRYQYLHPTRITEKTKQKFLKSLLTDIMQMRTDIKVIEYDRKKNTASHNLYVGNITNADKIICTYYDTPPNHVGSYHFFDAKVQKKKTTLFILINSLALIVLGLLGTVGMLGFFINFETIFSVQTLCVAFIYALYFCLLGKVTKGNLFQKTLVRNSSSVLTILNMIKEQKEDKRVAFAFLDDGCYGERGLEVMRVASKKNAKIFYLDSIGSNEPLTLLGKDFKKAVIEKYHLKQIDSSKSINYLFSSQEIIENNQSIFLLSKKNLKQKKINMTNIKIALELLN